MLIIGIAGIRAARRAARRAALAGPRRAAHRAVESHAKPHRVAALWGEGGGGSAAPGLPTVWSIKRGGNAAL